MRGDTLIEVLIALAVAVVVISAITTLGITSLSNARFVASQEQASKYTQEGMETVRKIRNGNYSAFASYSGTYCLAKNATSLGISVASCTTANIDNTYIRSVEIRQNVNCGAISTNLAHTTVRVSFTDGKCPSGVYCHTTESSSCLSTLPPIQGP
jgi:prepilin-type N-terminal cleavage/methylation domain-containing protein